MIATSDEQPRIAAHVVVQHADIVLDCDGFPFGEHSLCAAVATEMERALGPLAHADFGGRDGAGGAPLHRFPVVRYRLRRGRPHLHLVGPLAHQHARAVLAHLDALRTPTGDVVPVRPTATLHTTPAVGVHRRYWHEYELVSPVVPARVAIERMPQRSTSWAIGAWASAYMATALTTLLEHLGAHLDAPLYAHLEGAEVRRVAIGDLASPALFGTLVTNAHLPDGIGVGARTAFGFGELRLRRLTKAR